MLKEDTEGIDPLALGIRSISGLQSFQQIGDRKMLKQYYEKQKGAEGGN
jgi:hypothetical protein